jgi:hypothetical protein
VLPLFLLIRLLFFGGYHFIYTFQFFFLLRLFVFLIILGDSWTTDTHFLLFLFPFFFSGFFDDFMMYGIPRLDA